ncbi:hypothetical protein FBU30_002471 [Linnemannia zychae]|nr:hypothetical protein FBU30_002471 [Linnemannia zychae]
MTSIILSPSPFSIFILTLFFTTRVNAQIPTVRRRAAYTVYNNQFYVQGGILPTAEKSSSGDLNRLNLTAGWAATAAPWTTLAVGQPVWHHAMVAIEPKFSAGLGTGTQGYLLAVGGASGTAAGFWAAYNIQTDQWTSIATSSADSTYTPYIALEGHTATVDPSTGLVYVIGGFDNGVGLPPGVKDPQIINRLLVFDPKTATVLSQELATATNSFTGANAVWSARRGTVLLVGGSRAASTGSVKGLDMGVLTEYNPTTKQWTTMTTTGAIPPGRLDACTAISEDGSKLVVYGGAADGYNFYNTIYMLDLITGVWTAGPTTTEKVTQATCAYSGGMFVVFSGSIGNINTNDMNKLTGTTPLVYEVSKGSWASSYTPSATSGNGGNNGNNGNSGNNGGGNPGNPISPSRPNKGGGGNGDPDDPTGGNKNNLGAIIGAIIGVVVLVLVLLGVYLVRRRRNRRKKETQETEARVAALMAAEEKYDKDRQKRIEEAMKMSKAQQHYAAAQAALEEVSKRLRPSAFKGAKSWVSEVTNSNSNSDEGNTVDLSKARRLSDPDVQMDPELQYQQLLIKQRQLQQQHPNLIGFTLRNPHSCAAGESEDSDDSRGSGSDSDCNSGGESVGSNARNSCDSLHEHKSLTTKRKSKRLKVKTDKIWVPPQGIQELIVSPSPSSPQDWGLNAPKNIAYENMLTKARNDSTYDIELSPSVARSPHAIVQDLKIEYISSSHPPVSASNSSPIPHILLTPDISAPASKSEPELVLSSSLLQ